MNLRTFRTVSALVAAGLLTAGCQEQLTAPGSCPATCPGGTPVLRDTVLDALADQDSTYSGYVVRGTAAGGMQASNAFLGETRHAVIRFRPRLDSIMVRDTNRSYTIDSVVIELTVMARDTLATGMVLGLHRIPATVDSNVTFAEIDPLVTPGTLIDSVTLADTIRPFVYRFRFVGDTLAAVAIPPGDSSVFAMAVALTGGTASGVRLGGLGSGLGRVPILKTFVTLDVPPADSLVQKQTIATPAGLTTFVSSAPAPAPDPAIHFLGGADANRILLRFPWPPYLRDSALLARATVELVPVQAFEGLPGDTGFIDLHGIRVDLGAKSTVIFPFRGTKALTLGSADTVRIDFISEVQFWQLATLPHPPAVVVRMDPEGSSFTAPQFYSTREAVAARRPRLRITYQLPFDFERP